MGKVRAKILDYVICLGIGHEDGIYNGWNIKCYVCHLLTHHTLQPKPLSVETWNLVWKVSGGILFGSSEGFLNFRPWAEIWGWGGVAPEGWKISKNFFKIFSNFWIVLVKSSLYHGKYTKKFELFSKLEELCTFKG